MTDHIAVPIHPAATESPARSDVYSVRMQGGDGWQSAFFDVSQRTWIYTYESGVRAGTMPEYWVDNRDLPVTVGDGWYLRGARLYGPSFGNTDHLSTIPTPTAEGYQRRVVVPGFDPEG